MGIGRSTFYDTPDARARDLTIVAEMKTICDEFEAYGYRRVDAELRHRGIVVNAKKLRRLMREHALNPKQRRRFVATTDSDHNYPIFPNLAKNMKLEWPHQVDTLLLSLFGRLPKLQSPASDAGLFLCGTRGTPPAGLSPSGASEICNRATRHRAEASPNW